MTRRLGPARALTVLLLAGVLGGCSPQGGAVITAPGAPPTSTAQALPSRVTTPTPAEELAPGVPRATPIGTSVRGKPITAERFGAGPRAILILGGIHGDEYGTDAAGALADHLRSIPGDIPAGVEIHVIACLNPDGREADARGNANGVDLNLNFPTDNWVRELHPRTSASQHGLDGGSSAGSEPETKAVIGYVAATEFELIVSLHSSGGIIDWDGPGGDEIAREMSRISGMPAQHLAVQPYATGTLGQYAPDALGIPVITIELDSRALEADLRDAILAAAKGF